MTVARPCLPGLLILLRPPFPGGRCGPPHTPQPPLLPSEEHLTNKNQSECRCGQACPQGDALCAPADSPEPLGGRSLASPGPEGRPCGEGTGPWSACCGTVPGPRPCLLWALGVSWAPCGSQRQSPLSPKGQRLGWGERGWESRAAEEGALAAPRCPPEARGVSIIWYLTWNPGFCFASPTHPPWGRTPVARQAVACPADPCHRDTALRSLGRLGRGPLLSAQAYRPGPHPVPGLGLYSHESRGS